jgi:hypothetical protein
MAAESHPALGGAPRLHCAPVGRRLIRDHSWFAAVFATGALLRLLVAIEYRPALLFTDSLFYIQLSEQGSPVGIAPERPSGYPLFLHLVRLPSSSFAPTTTLQHLAGLATGGLVYVLLLRLGVGRRLAALASALVLLDMYAIALEQHVMPEAIFTLLIVAALGMVATPAAGPRLLALSGLLLAVAISFRVAGLLVVPVWLGYLALRHRKLVPAIAATAALALPLIAYGAWHHHNTGHFGLTQASGWFLYARVGEIGDCDGASVPPDARAFCNRTPRDDNEGASYFLVDKRSPGVRAFGGMSPDPKTQARTDHLAREYATAIVKDRPLRYAGLVAADFTRFFTPGAKTGYGAEAAITLPDPDRNAFLDDYQSRGDTLESVLRAYQSVFHTPRWLMALLLVGAAAGLTRRSGHRAEIVLFGGSALAMLAGSVATSDFDLRYLLPAVPLIVIAGTAGANDLRMRR